jgi:hypothetical protein
MLGYGSTAFLISIGPMISNHGDNNRLGAARHELARQADGKIRRDPARTGEHTFCGFSEPAHFEKRCASRAKV